MYNFARYIFLVVFFCAGTLVSCAEDDPLETKGAATQEKTNTDTTGTTGTKETTAPSIEIDEVDAPDVEVEYYGQMAAASSSALQGTTCIGDSIYQFYHGADYGIYRFDDLALLHADKAPLPEERKPHCWIVNHYITDANDTIIFYAGYTDNRIYHFFRKNDTALEFEQAFSFFPWKGRGANYFVDYPKREFYALYWDADKQYIRAYPFEGDLLETIGDLKVEYSMKNYVKTVQDVLFFDHYLYITYGAGTDFRGYVRVDLEDLNFYHVDLVDKTPYEEPEGFFEHNGELFWVTSSRKVFKIIEK